MRLKIFFDGSSHGNPGPSGIGVIILDETGRVLDKLEEYAGIRTNNEAEYLALIKALEKALELGAGDVELYSDSELLVKQINGEYSVKSENLRNLHRKAVELMGKLNARLTHVKREKNREANKLANKAAGLHH